MSRSFEEIENNRKKGSFKFGQWLVKVLYHRPKFFYIGEELPEKFLFIVNHCGSNTPTRVECYFPRKFYMWGTYEMTEGVKAVRKYLIYTYYHQKKRMPIFFAHIVGTIFAPFANMFYQGMHIIATYQDSRFINTINQSMQILKENKGIVVYPEDSSHGYKDQIDTFYHGFLMLCEATLRKGMDLPIFVAHYHKKKKTFIIDKPIKYSELAAKHNGDRSAMSEQMRLRMNELAYYPIDKKKK